MIGKLAAVPRWFYRLSLIVSILGLLLMLVSSASIDSRPVADAPFEYWVYIGLGILLLLGLAVSLNYSFGTTRRLSSYMVAMGLVGTVSFLLRISSVTWTGNTIAIGIASLMFFALASFLRAEELKTSTQVRK